MMFESPKRKALIFDNINDLSKGAAEIIADLAGNAISKEGRFSLVLAGGSTPKPLYKLLAQEYKDKIAWFSTHLFWGDERFVPPDDPESNYGTVKKILISRIDIPPTNVHPIPTDLANPERAAINYQRHLKIFFKTSAKQINLPHFDLVLLGIGKDGHTASLFPNDPVLQEFDRWAAPVIAPQNYQVRERITLTIPAINAARKIFFLVSGKEKRDIVKFITETGEGASQYPAAMVKPSKELIWFIDREAAGEI